MNISHVFGFGLLAITLAAGAAQAGQQAAFHLPFEARWGELTMAPGDYKVSLPEVSLGIRQFSINGGDKTGFVQPMVTDDEGIRSHSSDSYLELVKVNGTYFVAKYRSGATGKMFSFEVPKKKHEMELANRDVVKLRVSGN